MQIQPTPKELKEFQGKLMKGILRMSKQLQDITDTEEARQHTQHIQSYCIMLEMAWRGVVHERNFDKVMQDEEHQPPTASSKASHTSGKAKASESAQNGVVAD